MIRIRHAGGSHTFPAKAGTTFGELQAFVSEHTGIAPEQQTGFPPHPVVAKAEATLEDASVGIRAGDSVIVERGDCAGDVALAAATPVAPSAPRSTAAPVDDVSVHVPLGDAAVLTLKTVPDDNSCLYNALSFLQHQQIGQGDSQGLRELAAAGIRENPADYPDAVLGEARDRYIAKLLRPTTWGGALEIAVFAQTLRVEIWCWDVQSGVCHRFGQGQGFEKVWLLAYSGIHYDALIALPEVGTPLEWATTTFPHTDAALLADAGTRLIETLRSRHYYTDTASFQTLCKVCRAQLTGEKGVAEHARTTGHTDFGET